MVKTVQAENEKAEINMIVTNKTIRRAVKTLVPVGVAVLVGSSAFAVDATFDAVSSVSTLNTAVGSAFAAAAAIGLLALGWGILKRVIKKNIG